MESRNGRHSLPDGTYGEARVQRRGDIAEILALPGMAVAVAEILWSQTPAAPGWSLP